MIEGNVVGILDAGAQYGKLIDKCVRSLQVPTEIVDLSTEANDLTKYKALIISGGPDSITQLNGVRCDPNILKLNVPILGICYGMQLIVEMYNLEIQTLDQHIDGALEIEIVRKESELFRNLKSFRFLLTHGDAFLSDEDEHGTLQVSARLKNDKRIIVGIEDCQNKIYGVQFHPETELSEDGMSVFRIVFSSKSTVYTIDNRIANCEQFIKTFFDKRPNRKVVVLLSGGIDSAVCAVLISRVVEPQNVICVHVNNGFMRKDESLKVCRDMPSLIFGSKQAENFIYLNSEEVFLKALEDVKDPESKRQIIGNVFIKEILKTPYMQSDFILAQGTLRPDLIESGSHLASTRACCIKTHHNDSELVRKLRHDNNVLEPLIDFHKDEIRQIARKLQFPEWLVNRQPFPGPGLSIRILCADVESPDREYLEAVDALTKLSIQNGYDRSFSFKVLPIRSVGVSGDCRSYKYPISVFVKSSEIRDFSWVQELSDKLLKNVPHVNRIVCSFKCSANIKVVNRCRIDNTTVDLLRQCDHVVNNCFRKEKIQISQLPVILIPIGYEHETQLPPFSIVLRPVITSDFMTARVPLPDQFQQCLKDCAQILMSHYVHNVYYDLTSKPPGTTEWE